MAVRRAPVRVAATIAALGLLLAGCGGTKADDIAVGPGKGWPSAFHDARNSGSSPVTGSRHLELAWSRPIGGPAAAPTTIGPDGQLFVTTRAEVGCVGRPGTTGLIFSFQMETGRKRFCNALGPAAIGSPTVVDGATNVYLGDDALDVGGVSSFNALGQPRWRTPVAGVPVSLQFTGDSKVLSVTQFGQVDVLSRQTGDREVPTFQVLGEPDFLKQPDLPRPPNGQGIDDCATGAPQCPVANVSAIDQDSGRFYLTAWRPGTPVASLVALRYDGARISQEWNADLLTEGSATSPTLSADGKTIYVGDNSGRLLAVNAADGHVKWVQPLGFQPRGAVSAHDGLLIPGGDDGHLLALRDAGDRAEIAWERKDLELRGRPVQTAGGTGYVVAPIGDALNLVTFDTGNSKTLASTVLPGARGTTSGIAIGPKGEVVVTTRIGELFAFEPEK
ncbi:PQQ-binding-like beta-propeller repeat protein [Nocardia sp. CDC159]|uniref:PQQ-binding-like beta-propeller repeat protein n=2 Tax=Nocardiaceae TaxID=85025 RepID=A0A9X2EC60_9NOCA|nr:PQQ-binding-like beta-propeller repeat protein [Nocardia pulmonis]MCM6788917.1 PQQ-binding-like beta-propeller repeat protein [Nocardia sp. CDC159]